MYLMRYLVSKTWNILIKCKRRRTVISLLLIIDFVSSIQTVESRSGPINTWPTCILHYLFRDVPIPTVMIKLIAFFYGNGIPCSMAVHLFHACNDRRRWYWTILQHIWQLAKVRMFSSSSYILQYAGRKICFYQRFSSGTAWNYRFWHLCCQRIRTLRSANNFEKRRTYSKGSVLVLTSLCILYMK